MNSKLKIGPSAFSACWNFLTNKWRPAKQVSRRRGRVWLAWLVGPSGQHKQLQTEGGGGGVNQFQGKPIRQPDNFKTLKSCQNQWLVNSFQFSKLSNLFQTCRLCWEGQICRETRPRTNWQLILGPTAAPSLLPTSLWWKTWRIKGSKAWPQYRVYFHFLTVQWT